MGTTVLALIGLFNIFGTYTAGWLGGRMSKPRLLTALYLLRAVVIALFLWAPITQVSAYLGSSGTFAEALVGYANGYADQVERDYATFRDACRSGRVLAQTEADFAADFSA